ncbi:MAG: hypothetical protein HC782_02095 [Gammaproteobacteria bacterium]|nr:hypothetical protein [Gammaproteobacteria bacterium]
MANYYVDEWFDLTSEQSAWLKPRIAKLMTWHRANELPTYRTLLADARQRLEKNANPQDDIARFYNESRQAVDRLTLKALPDMVAFLQTIDGNQIVNLEKKFATDNEKLAKEMRISIDARRAKRLERTIERYEAWMGKLTETQVALITTSISSLPLTEMLRLTDRQRWQADFVALLNTKPNANALESALRVLFITPEKNRAPEYQAAWLRQQDEMMKLTSNLIATASPKQKQAMQKKLAGYEEDLSGLLKV